MKRNKKETKTKRKKKGTAKSGAKSVREERGIDNVFQHYLGALAVVYRSFLFISHFLLISFLLFFFPSFLFIISSSSPLSTSGASGPKNFPQNRKGIFFNCLLLRLSFSLFPLYCIFGKGCVRRSVGPSVRQSPVFFRRVLGASSAVYPALLLFNASI